MKVNLGISAMLAKAKLVLYTVLQFLQSDDLSNLHQQVKYQQNSSDQSILNILEGYIYIRFHMNGTDRSYYNYVYSSSIFLNIEKSIIAYHVQSTNIFKYFYHLSHHLHNYLLNNLKCSNCQEAASDIWHLFNDPDIPTFKLLRQTVGIGCKSLFQNFLICFTTDSSSLMNDEYQTLSQFYQKRTEQAYIRQFFKIDRSKHKSSDFFKIKKLRYSAYYIKCQQMETYLLPSNQIHNFLVTLFAMADLIVQSSSAYLNGIDDPYYRLMQFSLRYSLYRNFVLNIQVIFSIIKEKFSFIFDIYSSLYEDVFVREQVRLPAFSFWRPALSKWLLYMTKYHEECIQVVNLHTLVKRQNNLISVFDTLTTNNKPLDYMTIQNSLKLLSPQKFCTISQPINKQIYELIQQQIQYSIHQFKQYLVDLSIDQITVHWCGHSKQQLQLPYLQYETRTLNMSKIFIDQLIKIPHKLETALQLLKIDLRYIQKNQCYHPRLISKYIQLIKYKLTTQSSKQQNNIQFKYELHNSDDRIKLLNEKQKIPNKIQQKSHQFFKLLPIPQEEISQFIQMKSFQTMDNSNQSYLSQNSQEIQRNQYRSENDNQEEIDEENNNNDIKQIQKFLQDWPKTNNESLQLRQDESNCKKKNQESNELT